MAGKDPQLKKLEKDLADAQKSFKKAQKAIASKQTDLSKKNALELDLKDKLQKAADEIKDVEEEIKNAKQALKSIWANYTSSNHNRVSFLDDAKLELKNAIKNLNEGKIDEIPKHVEKLALDAINANNPVADELNKKLKEIATLRKTLSNTTDKAKVIDDKILNVQTAIDDLKNEIDLLTKQAEDEVKNAQAALDAYKAQLMAGNLPSASQNWQPAHPQPLGSRQPVAPEFEVKDQYMKNRTASEIKAHDEIYDHFKNNVPFSKIDYPDGFLKDEHGGPDYIPITDVSGETEVKRLFFQMVNNFEQGQKTMLSRSGAPGLHEYTTGSFTEINNWLRGISDPRDEDFVRQTIENLDKELEGCVVPVNIVVQRAVRGPDSIYGNLKPGDIITDDAVISTSISSNSGFNGKYILRIRIRAGSIGAFAPALSAFPREAEIILPRRSSFFVKKVEESVDKWGGKRFLIYCDLLQRNRS